MPKTIISDTSCFIVLSKIEELDLLRKAYGSVLTTREVESEFGEELPAWIEIKSAIDIQLQKVLELQLDKGRPVP